MCSNVLYLIGKIQEFNAAVLQGMLFCGGMVAQRGHALPKFELHPTEQAILDDTSCIGSVESLPCFNALNLNENSLGPMSLQL